MAYVDTYKAEAYATERMRHAFDATTDEETENHVEYWKVLDEWTDHLIRQSEACEQNIEDHADFVKFDQTLDDIIKKHTL